MTSAEVQAAQRLRYRSFVASDGVEADSDDFDDLCRHVLVEDVRSGQLVATCRVLPIGSGGEIGRSYSAQYYDLSGLAGYAAPMIELGRFCVAANARDPDILRAVWGGVAQVIDDTQSRMLFGCASFKGTDASAYADTFSMLRERHLAPRRWRPRIKAPQVFSFARRSRRVTDRTKGLRRMPSLLRSYISLGGWVSDHAVVDNELNTLHVFTGLEVSAIPTARAQFMRDPGGITK